MELYACILALPKMLPVTWLSAWHMDTVCAVCTLVHVRIEVLLVQVHTMIL
jgi:hypothetical protein